MSFVDSEYEQQQPLSFQAVFRGKLSGIDTKTSSKKTIELDIKVIVVDVKYKKLITEQVKNNMIMPLCLYAFMPLCLYAFMPLCLC
jgi:hypothetical protein